MVQIKLINDKEYFFTIEVFATILNYNTNYYLVTTHLGLKIDKIEYNNNIYTEFIYGHWSGLIILKLNEKPTDKVFSQIMKSHIDPLTNIKIDDMKAIYIKQQYFPINMIPSNPSNLYYKVKSTVQDTGKPLYHGNKLYGIVSKCESNYVYVIPSIYIIRTIEKKINDILICKTKEIKSIGKYKVYDNIIYSKEFRYQIKLEAYLSIIADIDNRINYNYTNNYLKYKNIKKSYYINTYILHYCKMFNEELLMKIFENFNSCHKSFDFEINGIKKCFIYE
jgi:hypothetical protein